MICCTMCCSVYNTPVCFAIIFTSANLSFIKMCIVVWFVPYFLITLSIWMASTWTWVIIIIMRIYQHICVKMKQCVFLNDTETLPAGPPQYLLIRLLYWLQGNKQKESFHRTLRCHVKRSKYTTGIKMVNIIKVLLTKYISLSDYQEVWAPL